MAFLLRVPGLKPLIDIQVRGPKGPLFHNCRPGRSVTTLLGAALPQLPSGPLCYNAARRCSSTTAVRAALLQRRSALLFHNCRPGRSSTTAVRVALQLLPLHFLADLFRKFVDLVGFADYVE
jgi:hypothetical protein